MSNKKESLDLTENQFDLAKASKAIKESGSGIPPVDKWNPDFCGDIDMRIAAEGTNSAHGDTRRPKVAQGGTRWHKSAQVGTRRHKVAQVGTSWHKAAHDGRLGTEKAAEVQENASDFKRTRGTRRQSRF